MIYLADVGFNIFGRKIKKGISPITGLGITLTNNGLKDIVKVIKSLENRGILLKGTTGKITSPEEEFYNFLQPLITAGLPIMKCVLTPFAKSVLILLALTAAASAADAAFQKKKKNHGPDMINDFKWRNGRCNENS